MLVDFDWKAFNPRAGLQVIVAIAVAALFADVAGLDGAITALAALVLSIVDVPGSLRPRIAKLMVFTALLTGITGIAWLVEGKMWPVVITITAIALIGGLALRLGPAQAAAISFLNVWLIILLPSIDSLSFGDAVAAVLIAGAFVIVGVVAFAVVAAKRHPADATASSDGSASDHAVPDPPRLDWRSPVTIYAVSKAVAAGSATLIGWSIVGSHPFWATFAPLMIIKPDLQLTLAKGVDRVIGTVLGGAVGYMLIEPITNDTMIALLFLVSIFFQFATTKVHYGLMVFFLTLEIILSGDLSGGIADSLSFDRILATVIGVIISFVTVLILSLFIDDEERSGKWLPAGAT